MTTYTPRLPILLVGSFHMANPGRDMANVTVDDMLSPERQAQLEVLAGRLAAFSPTKVVVEGPVGDISLLERYDRYRRHGERLGRSEVEQLGFRVAAHLGHDTIWPIDVTDAFFDPELARLAAADPAHGRLYEALQLAAGEIAARQQEWLATSTIGATLARMNEPEAFQEALGLYIRFLTPIADAPTYPGPDMVAAWYRRNLRILSHLHGLARPGDRLLVVFGHGHVALFHQLLAFSDTFETVDPTRYLAEPETII